MKNTAPAPHEHVVFFYSNRFGQMLWHELRGCHAGHDLPQFSIHRGRLQGLLYEEAKVPG